MNSHGDAPPARVARETLPITCDVHRKENTSKKIRPATFPDEQDVVSQAGTESVFLAAKARKYTQGFPGVHLV